MSMSESEKNDAVLAEGVRRGMLAKRRHEATGEPVYRRIVDEETLRKWLLSIPDDDAPSPRQAKL